MKPNILVCGKTGVGKTSLIQSVTHIGTVPDSAIARRQPTKKGFDLYETDIANFIDAEGVGPGQTIEEYAESIKNKMIERPNSNAIDYVIHAIWYCIDGAGAQIQEADEQFIKTFGKKALVVVTKSEIMSKNQYDFVVEVLSNLINPEKIVIVSSQRNTGLAKLIEKSLLISEESAKLANEEITTFSFSWNQYYSQMANNWQKKMNDEADSLIRWTAGKAAFLATSPVPVAEVYLLLMNETYMVYRMGGIYGYAATEATASMLREIAGGSIKKKVFVSFFQGFKIVISARIAYGVGKAAKAYFASNMKINSSELKEEFKKGEKEAKKVDWKENKVEDDNNEK
jgi:uncharacterized protein (DUF697 family)/predicted GTPase